MKDSIVKFIDENGETKYIAQSEKLVDSYSEINTHSTTRKVFKFINETTNRDSYFGVDKIVFHFFIGLIIHLLVKKYNNNKEQNSLINNYDYSSYNFEKENVMNIIRHFKTNNFKDSIKNAFPEDYDTEIENFFSKSILNDNENEFFSEYLKFFINEIEYNLPARIDIKEISEYKYQNLSELQQILLSCIFTLNPNGYVRERHLRNLRGIDYDWVIPFKLNLLGDYVLEIVKELHYQIDDSNITAYQKFIDNNFKFYRLQSSRMVSYWSEYYRYYPNYNVVCQAKCKEFCQIDGKLIQDAECNLKFEFTKKYARSFTKQLYPGFQIIEKLKIRNK